MLSVLSHEFVDAECASCCSKLSEHGAVCETSFDAWAWSLDVGYTSGVVTAESISVVDGVLCKSAHLGDTGLAGVLTTCDLMLTEDVDSSSSESIHGDCSYCSCESMTVESG